MWQGELFEVFIMSQYTNSRFTYLITCSMHVIAWRVMHQVRNHKPCCCCVGEWRLQSGSAIRYQFIELYRLSVDTKWYVMLVTDSAISLSSQQGRGWTCVDEWWCVMLQLTSRAAVLLRQVFEHLGLVDRQYFGLRFIDNDDSEPVRLSLRLVAWS